MLEVPGAPVALSGYATATGAGYFRVAMYIGELIAE